MCLGYRSDVAGRTMDVLDKPRYGVITCELLLLHRRGSIVMVDREERDGNWPGQGAL